MNETIFSKEDMLTIFEMLLDSMIDGKIEYNDYLPNFRKEFNVTENSPFEFMFRGFIGGLYIASLEDPLAPLQE